MRNYHIFGFFLIIVPAAWSICIGIPYALYRIETILVQILEKLN
jgi:hypothetical protein